MKLIKTSLIILLSLCFSGVLAGEQRQIELKDGSVISGEIVSFNNGVYTIKSDTLGTLEIEDAKIQAIHSKKALAGQAFDLSNFAISPELQQLQSVMMNDKEIMNTILSLQSDPQFQAVLQDPAVKNAISSGNLNSLIANPNFMKLLEHQTVQEIAKQVEEK